MLQYKNKSQLALADSKRSLDLIKRSRRKILPYILLSLALICGTDKKSIADKDKKVSASPNNTSSQLSLVSQAIVEFQKIEKELEKFHHRKYNKFSDVSLSLTDQQVDLFREALPALLTQNPGIKFKKVLSWMRLYNLHQDICDPNADIMERAKKILTTYIKEAPLSTDFHKYDQPTTEAEKLMAQLQGVDLRLKELFALYELVDKSLHKYIYAELDSFKDFILKTNPQNMLEYLELLLEDSAKVLPYFLKPLTIGDIEKFKEESLFTRRGMGLRSIAMVFERDPSFIAVKEKSSVSRASLLTGDPKTEIEYYFEDQGEVTRWKVEVFVPPEDDSLPMFVLRDVEKPDRFVNIATGSLLEARSSMNALIYIPRIKEHLKRTIEHYKLENDPDLVRKVKDFDLKSYDRIVMIPCFQETHDFVVGAVIFDQLLAQYAYQHMYGEDKIDAVLIRFTSKPSEYIKSTIEKYKEKYPNEKIIFDIYLGAHGSESYIAMGENLDPSVLSTIAKDLGTNINVRSCACKQGGLVEAFSKAVEQTPELKDRISTFPVCAPYGYGFVSAPYYAKNTEWIRNSYRTSLYELSFIIEILKGRALGAAHIKADRRVNNMKSSKSNAQGFFLGMLIGDLLEKSKDFNTEKTC